MNSHPRCLAAFALVMALACALFGCRRAVGDGCRTHIECDVNGARRCDLTQNGGYCTVPECVADSCPDQSICIEFNAQTPRLARRFCMASCEVDTDCRGGYRCANPTVIRTAECPASMSPPGETDPICTRWIDTEARAMAALPDRRREGRFCVQNTQ